MLLFSFVLVLVCLVYILVQVWREHKVNLKMFNEYPVGSRYQVFEKTINDIDYYTIFCLTFRGWLLTPVWNYYEHYVSREMAYHNCSRLNKMQIKDYSRDKIKAELKNVEQYRKL